MTVVGLGPTVMTGMESMTVGKMGPGGSVCSG